MPSSVSFDGAMVNCSTCTKRSTLTSRAPIPREKFQTFCFELEKEIYSIFELTGLPGCSNWETPSSDSLKARRAAVTKFAHAQTFDGFVHQKALYAIDL